MLILYNEIQINLKNEQFQYCKVIFFSSRIINFESNSVYDSPPFWNGSKIFVFFFQFSFEVLIRFNSLVSVSDSANQSFSR